MTRTRQAARAAAPVAPIDASYASVLVPLDGSEDAEPALGPAQRLATSFDAALHIVAGDVPRVPVQPLPHG